MTKVSEKNIRVAIRVRPLNHSELAANQRTIIRILDKQNLIFDPEDDVEEFFYHGVKQTHRDLTKRERKKMPMEYDDVFQTDATNQDVFETCTLGLLDSLMEGYNCSVFVYGATGAGKTFTMLGNPETPGITFLTMRALFEKIAEHEADRKFEIGISYLEVYNEQVMNLLAKSGPLNLREDAGGVVVSGLQLTQIHNATQLLNLLAQGNQNRTQHATDANAESSRSHAIFQVHIRMTDKKTSQKKLVKLSMIDLAGSERAASTQCKGARFKEGANINKSLLALGNCINKLAEGSKYVPYRDSKLTRILKDSLGGNCQTVMITNVSPSSLTYDDTYNSLKYASRAKKIKTSLRQIVIASNVPKEYLIKKASEATEENELLKARIKVLEARVKELESQKSPSLTPVISATTSSSVEDISPQWNTRIETVFDTLRVSQEQFFLLQSREKVNALKQKFKLYIESVKSSVGVEGLDEENRSNKTILDSVSKQQAAKDREDSQRYRKIHRQAEATLEQLKLDIESAGLEGSLGVLLKNKELELHNNKLELKVSHIHKVNGLYDSEIDYWKNLMNDGFKLLRQLYLLHRANNRLDRRTDELYERLLKQCSGRQKVVTFLEESSAECESADLSFSNSPGGLRSGKKRTNLSDSNPASKVLKTLNGNVAASKPKAIKSINFGEAPASLNATHVIGPSPLNCTFDLASRALTESTVNTKDSGTLQRKPGLLSKAAVTISKENRKFKVPARIAAKSPRKISKAPPINGVHKERVNPTPKAARNQLSKI